MLQRKKVMKRAVQRLLTGGGAPVPPIARFNNWRRGFGAWSYIYYGLGEDADVREFLPDITMRDMTALNDGMGKHILTNKLVFERAIGTLAPVPPVLAALGRGSLVPLGTPALRDAEDLVAYCRTVGPLILKPIDGKKGRGVRRLSFDDDGTGGRTALRLNDTEVDVSRLRATLAGLDAYLVVAFAQQAPYASAIFPDATNTIRVVTMLDPTSGEAFVAASEHRFGTKRSAPTDNFSGGGVIGGLDPVTGRLGPVRWAVGSTLMRSGTHPETGAPIEGVTVPGWQEAKAMVLRVAEDVPSAPYVGWDVLITPGGAVLIEGNAGPSLHSQMSGFPYLRDPRVRAFVEHHGVWRDRPRARRRVARVRPASP